MLFGTDGIRGKVVDSLSNDEDAIAQLLDDRMISARLMRVIAEALNMNKSMYYNLIISLDYWT